MAKLFHSLFFNNRVERKPQKILKTKEQEEARERNNFTTRTLLNLFYSYLNVFLVAKTDS